jgi:hypothetical protein
VICLLVFGALILALFCIHEARFASNPLIPARILSSRSNVASILFTCLHSFVFISYDYFLPLYYQAALGMTAIISGVCLLALVLPLSAMTMTTGWYIRRTGDYRLPICIGGCFMALGTGLFISLGPNIDWAKIILFQIVAGLGAGPLFQSPMIALQSHVKQADVAAAMSASSFMRSLFTSTSIVVGSVLLQKTLHGGSLVSHTEAGSASVDHEEVGGTYTSALRVMWSFYCAICGVMVMVSMFIKKMPAQKHDEGSQKTKSNEKTAS